MYNYKRTWFCFALVFLIVAGISGCSPDPGMGDKMKVAGVFSTSLEEPRAAVIYQGLRKAEREMEVTPIPPEYSEKIDEAPYPPLEFMPREP